jgi:hypothetical protein
VGSAYRLGNPARRIDNPRRSRGRARSLPNELLISERDAVRRNIAHAVTSSMRGSADRSVSMNNHPLTPISGRIVALRRSTGRTLKIYICEQNADSVELWSPGNPSFPSSFTMFKIHVDLSQREHY